jgi:hypothetical protein
MMNSKNKIATAKKIVSKISVPSQNKIENSHTLFNLQIGKIILKLRRE